MEKLDRYIGTLLDRRYRIHRVIGVGGMSVVFEATDLVMNRTVAVKMLRDEIRGDEQAVSRFINESKAVSMLSHPNIVKIFDVSVKGSPKYIVMERVEGITLKSYMQKKGALSLEEVLSYSEQVLKALEQAHAKGIVHRDIKPQNVLLLKNGRVKVTDFGIAKLPESETGPVNEKAVGTVYYISPEQAGGKGIDSRSDLYSVGVLMYEMATGVLPFNGDTPLSVAMMQIKEQPKPPTELKPDLPRGLEQIILGAMEKQPERRFQSAEQMLRYIARLRANPGYIFKTRKSNESTGTTAGVVDTNMKKKKKAVRKKRESRSMFPIVLGVSVAFLIVFITSAVMILDMVMKDQNQNAPQVVQVPSLVGNVYDDEMKAKLDPAIYHIVIETVYDAGTAPDTVIKQDPDPGVSRKVIRNKQYCTVTLTLSRGAQLVTVPDYSIMEYRTVQLAASRLGFTCELIAVDSETVEVGYVITTDPAARSSVAYGSKLTIYYSRGVTIQRIDVPVLTGLTPVEAYVKMNGAFRVGEVFYEYSDTVKEGLILKQSLPSGTQAVRGTTINFTISLGPVPETDPPDTEQDPESPLDEPTP